jgi:hypothetical protein
VQNPNRALSGWGGKKNRSHRLPSPFSLDPPCLDLLFLSLIDYCSYPACQLCFLSASLLPVSFLSIFSPSFWGCVLYILFPCDPVASLSISLSLDLVLDCQEFAVNPLSFVPLVINFEIISIRTYRLSMLVLGST